MSQNAHLDPDIRIDVTPLPEPEELSVIVAALRSYRRRQQAAAVAEPLARPATRWARAGRHEAMDARTLVRSDEP